VRHLTLVLVWTVASSCGPKVGRAGEPFPAQSIWAAPPRPRLPQEADTNDARAYYTFGTLHIRSRPDTAAAAFYWATQLDPWRADAYYGRAVALMRTLWEPDKYAYGMWMPKRPLRENELEVVDSLNRLAYELDPYIDRRFDYLVGPPAAEVICDRVRNPMAAGACYMQARNFGLSLQKLGAALKKDPKQIALHYLRAHAYYQLRHFDSAAAELGVLADSLGNRQEKGLTAFYVSRATIYYAQGMAYTQMDDTAAARAAYERALVEDLAFHMASVRLAGRALSSGDTTTALSHLAHAVSVRPADARLRLFYGIILASRDQRTAALEQFRAAIETSPHFASPYLHIGQELEKTDRDSAIAAYDAFLVRSAQSDSTNRRWVEWRLQRLLASP
jgi:Tfp pilus assembly protein PilF